MLNANVDPWMSKLVWNILYQKLGAWGAKTASAAPPKPSRLQAPQTKN